MQALLVYLARQDSEPQGWQPEDFGGAFPQGGTYTIKVLLPPTHKSWRDRNNYHTITLILAVGDNPANHLLLGAKLQRLISHHCTCRSGARTNSACCHVAAAVIALFGPALFRTAKVEEPRISDPEKYLITVLCIIPIVQILSPPITALAPQVTYARRPTEHCPVLGGVPGNDRDLTLLVTPPPDPRPQVWHIGKAVTNNTSLLQFPSSRINLTVPASPPQPGSMSSLTGGPADQTGYEPHLHPDQLPAPQPGQGSLLFQMSGGKIPTLTKNKQKHAGSAKYTGKNMPKTTKKDNNVNAPNTSDGTDNTNAHKSNQGKKTPQAPKTSNAPKTAASPDVSPLGGDLCTHQVPLLSMKNTVTLADYVRLQHSIFLNDVLIDFANGWLFSNAATDIGDSTYLFATQFYVALAALQRPKQGSNGEAKELAEGLPLPERHHGRVARWTRRVELFDKEVVLFPIGLDSPQEGSEKHWLLLVVLLGPDPVVVVMDSLGTQRPEQVTYIQQYMEVEARVKGRAVPSFRVLTTQVPQQKDGFNCGIFVTMYAARILADPARFSARARQDQLHDWFLPSAVSGQRSHWAEVIRTLGSRQAPRRARRFPNLQFEPPNTLTNIGCMVNLERCCFVVTAFLVLCWCDVPQNLQSGPEQSQAQQNLATTLITMANRRRNHQAAPMSPEPFVVAVNAMGQRQFLYTVRMEDTCELLETALTSLPLRPGFLVALREEGTCQHCASFCQQVRKHHILCLDWTLLAGLSNPLAQPPPGEWAAATGVPGYHGGHLHQHHCLPPRIHPELPGL